MIKNVGMDELIKMGGGGHLLSTVMTFDFRAMPAFTSPRSPPCFHFLAHSLTPTRAYPPAHLPFAVVLKRSCISSDHTRWSMCKCTDPLAGTFETFGLSDLDETLCTSALPGHPKLAR